ncbi:MAG TPA: LPXTG cell wall anchor domain-containing protein, partial [Ilumatobacteraceae bacterium]|nr:LPXTG cell wall anchor domain-containing protein [Ilumatobacteraceae bacterium]
TTTQPGVTTTTAGATTTTAAATTTVVGQEGPTSTVDQSSGAATTTVPVGRSLPATGNGSTSLVVIALTMIGIGAVMLRLSTRSTH